MILELGANDSLRGLALSQTRGNLQKIADAVNLQAIIVMPDGDRGGYINSVTPANYDECMNEALASPRYSRHSIALH